MTVAREDNEEVERVARVVWERECEALPPSQEYTWDEMLPEDKAMYLSFARWHLQQIASRAKAAGGAEREAFTVAARSWLDARATYLGDGTDASLKAWGAHDRPFHDAYDALLAAEAAREAQGRGGA